MRILLLALVAIAALAAAVTRWSPRETEPPQERTAAAPMPPASMPPASPGAACRPRIFEGTAFTVCRFDRRTDRLRMIYKPPSGPPLRSFAALEAFLGSEARLVRFAVNGGMFDEEGAPIGLFVEDGTARRRLNLREGGGNFHLLPNGVFAQGEDGRVHVVESARFADRVPWPRWATQSGPMLVIDGKLHPRFDADGPSRLIRNGVGVGDPDTAWFAIAEDGVSFGRFARLFRDELGCANALFLDGSVSSLWDPAAARQDAFAPLGPMIVVSR